MKLVHYVFALFPSFWPSPFPNTQLTPNLNLKTNPSPSPIPFALEHAMNNGYKHS